MKAILIAMVLAAVAFAGMSGSIGFGTGGMGQIAAPGIMPFVGSLEEHVGITGPLSLGAQGYYLSWAGESPIDHQEMMLIGLGAVGLQVQDTRLELGAGVADHRTDFRAGADRLVVDSDMALGLRWSGAVAPGVEMSAVYLWSAIEGEPLFGGLLFAKTL